MTQLLVQKINKSSPIQAPVSSAILAFKMISFSLLGTRKDTKYLVLMDTNMYSSKRITSYFVRKIIIVQMTSNLSAF